MKTIHKYEVPIEGRFSLQLPREAVILSFQCQNGIPAIWAEVETANSIQERWFRIYDTGQPIGNIPEYIGLHYIGMAKKKTDNGFGPEQVWHLFIEEVKK